MKDFINSNKKKRVILGVAINIFVVSFLIFQIYQPLSLEYILQKIITSKASTIGTVQILGTEVDNSSVKIYFKPVRGAADYRVYDVSNPMVVKYAGTKRYQPYGSFGFRTTNNDGVNPVYPFSIESNTPAGGGSSLNILTQFPQPFIEWNMAEDHKPHTLIVQAVDKLGPFPSWSAYDYSTFAPINPPSSYTNMMNMNLPSTLGINEGSTPDGNWSINGQGPTSNNPNVIAASQPFIIQASGTYKPIPSRADATQTFLDTFDDSEGSTVKLTNENLGTQFADPPGGKTMDYSMNSGTDHTWDIHYQSADTNLSFPFIDGGHFMDELFDESAGASWAVMAMKPENADNTPKTADISNGKMLHMTMEVDSTLDNPGRRWVGFDISPANDPLTSWNTGNPSVAPLNNSLQALFVEIYSSSTKVHLFDGSNTMIDLGQVERQQNYANTYQAGIGFDNRSRFDFYMTQKHYFLFEDGVLDRQGDFPNGGLPFTNLQIDFSHYMYHSAADLAEMGNFTDNGKVMDQFLYNLVAESDERHWDNIGFEVLPSIDAPSNYNDLTSLSADIQPPTPTFKVCPTSWNCTTLGGDESPLIMPSSQETDSSGNLTIHSGAVNSSSAPDLSYFVYKGGSGDTSIDAHLSYHANLSYWSPSGIAGVDIRQDLSDGSPFYLVGVGGDRTIHVMYRSSQGGAISDNSSGTQVSLPIYLKAVRSGSTFTPYQSSDGVNWTAVSGFNPTTINMSSTTQLGVIDWEWQNDPNLISGWNPQIGSATFDSPHVNSVLADFSIPSPVQYASVTPTPTPVPSVEEIYNDNNTMDSSTTGLLNGWTDCSSPGIYEHWTMGGDPNYSGDSTSLHTGVDPGSHLAFCSSGVAGYSSFDFWVIRDGGYTNSQGLLEPDPSLQINTMGGSSVNINIDRYIQGGDKTIPLTANGTWDHVVIPFSAIGLSSTSMITRIAWISNASPQTVTLMHTIELSGTVTPTPTSMPSSTPMVLTTPTANSFPADTYSSSMNLSGMKDSKSSMIMINNASPSGLSYSDSTHWSINMPLEIGANLFVINAMDDSGNMSSDLKVDITRHKQGDVDGDSKIDLTDFSIFAKDWERGSRYGKALYNPLSDQNGDGNVDLIDLSIFAKSWGS